MSLFYRLLAVLGSFASLVALILIEVPTIWHGIILMLATLLLVWTVILIVRDYVRTRPHIMPIGPKIQQYMYSWINQGGRVAMLSRDMSWAHEQKVNDLLKRKAQKGELCLCLPKHTTISEELKALGAEVHTFPEINFTPESRFTVINKGRTDAQLAVGRSDKGKHRVEEYSTGEHCVLWIANDLIDFITKFDEYQSSQGLRK